MTNELRAQAEWSARKTGLFHYRDRDGAEVDLVLETDDGRVVGIEVKSGAIVRADDLRGLRLLEQQLGEDFAAGIVLCTRTVPVHLGGRLLDISDVGAVARQPGQVISPFGDPGGGPSRFANCPDSTTPPPAISLFSHNSHEVPGIQRNH